MIFESQPSDTQAIVYVGADGHSACVARRLLARLRAAARHATVATRPARRCPGEVPLRFTVSPLAYSAQPLTLLVDDGGRFSLPTSTRIDFRLHLPASAVEAQG
ncbi:MAG: hypothetical protein ACOZQL_31585, partial [Myxococcota bacterium]